MIKGHGIDIVKISRIVSMIDKYNDTFLKKCFTDNEIRYCDKMSKAGLHYAGRWAVKEAFYKALSPSCQNFSFWHSIEVLSGSNGRPEVTVLTDELKKVMVSEEISSILVSISHEREFAIASVILQ